MLRTLLEKLGQDPKASMSLFLKGIGLFVSGICFITIGYYQRHYWQMIGIIIVAVALLICAWGYLGMFANRLLHILYRNQF